MCACMGCVYIHECMRLSPQQPIIGQHRKRLAPRVFGVLGAFSPHHDDDALLLWVLWLGAVGDVCG